MIVVSLIAAALAQPGQSSDRETVPPVAPAPAPAVATLRIPNSAFPACDAVGAPGIPALVAPDARPDLIINGLEFAEGPASDAQGRTFFCDMSSSRVWRIERAQSGFRAECICSETLGLSGLSWSRDGRLFGAQFSGGRVVEVMIAADGKATIREFVPAFESKRSVGVNDLVVDATGGIWFTNMGDPRRPENRGVYFTDAAGTAPVRFDVPGLMAPNGIRLSPDGRTLYVADFQLPQVWSFPVEGPGKIGAGQRFASLSVVGDGDRVLGGDGLAVDGLGNVWVAVPRASAIVVFDPKGKPLGRVMVPRDPSNCAFGGPDGRSLYITARDGIYLLPTLVEGYWTARGGGLPAGAASSHGATNPPAPPPAEVIAPAPKVK